MRPAWEDLATAAKGNFNVAMVDCTEEQDICSAYAIRSFPTIKLVRVGTKDIEYDGPRTVEAFTKFVNGHVSGVVDQDEEEIQVIYEDLTQSSTELKQEETKIEIEEKITKDESSKEEEKKKDDEEKPKKKKKKPKKKKEEPPTDILTLTDETFPVQVRKGDWLVEFIVPWCGHCQRLQPPFELAAGKLKGKYNVAKVDCTTQAATCGGQMVKGYPTIRFYVDGTPYDYQGPRETAEIVQFVEDTKKARDEL
eukprot:TRINITY_DN4112_c0_g1_i3.p1 TRINITY_DN4112_c0_g1~~TRINITY_DN4112_c0_g1_i3.p1  ORF type:complete len:252 (+),score=95.33 TRINITY_DN4112_c0_g1_i3:227-982(+)